MFKKLVCFMALALILSWMGTAFAQKFWDDGDADDHLWSSSENWYPDGVPDGSQYIYMLDTSHGTGDLSILDTSVSCTYMRGVYNRAADHEVRIDNGGTLTDNGYLYLAIGSSACTATITVNTGGSFVGTSASGPIRLSHPSAANAVVGIINVDGGTVDIKADLELSRGSDNRGLGSQGLVYLNSGTIYCGGLFMYEGAGEQLDDLMQIGGGGTLYVLGDVQEDIQDYIDAGIMTAQPGLHLEVTTETLASPQAGSGLYTKVTAVPEPGTMLLAGFGVLVLLVSRRKR